MTYIEDGPFMLTSTPASTRTGIHAARLYLMATYRQDSPSLLVQLALAP